MLWHDDFVFGDFPPAQISKPDVLTVVLQPELSLASGKVATAGSEQLDIPVPFGIIVIEGQHPLAVVSMPDHPAGITATCAHPPKFSGMPVSEC